MLPVWGLIFIFPVFLHRFRPSGTKEDATCLGVDFICLVFLHRFRPSGTKEMPPVWV